MYGRVCVCGAVCVCGFINQGCCLGVRIRTFEAWRMSQVVKHLVSYFTLPTPAKLFAKGFTPDILKCHTHSTLGTPTGHATRHHTLLKSMSIKKTHKDLLTQVRPECQTSAASVHVLLHPTPEWLVPVKDHEWNEKLTVAESEILLLKIWNTFYSWTMTFCYQGMK